MSSENEYKVAAIPLNRKEVVKFLKPPDKDKKGALVCILNQRPSVETEQIWAEKFFESPSVSNLLSRDDPHGQLVQRPTNRLIPIEFITEDDEYLTRNLGGWSPVYFGVIQCSDKALKSDPLLTNASVLKNYGRKIDWFGADEEQVRSRLSDELGTSNLLSIAKSVKKLYNYRSLKNFDNTPVEMTSYADDVYNLVAEKEPPPPGLEEIPRAILIDELTGQLVRIEQQRRAYVAKGENENASKIADWQQNRKDEGALDLILKSEYVMGRQRRSTILIAPKLGIVVKQPGPEPFHEAKMAAKTHHGRAENWPSLTRDGSLVTAAGRLRLIINEGLLVGLNKLFHHKIECFSSFGFFIEPYVSGPTLQEYIIEKPSRLKPEVYEFVLLHQFVCERFGVENGDWHSANFIVLPSKKNQFMDEAPAMIHIDWGAARPLKQQERTDEQRMSRINQVRNIAFSFHRPEIAKKIETVHDRITSDPDRIRALQNLADKIVKEGTT